MKIAGKLQELDIGGVALNGIVDANLSGEISQLNSTTHDNVESETFIPNRFSGTIDGTLNWDEADPGQVDLLDSALAKTTLAYLFRMETGAGFFEFQVNGNVASFNPTGPNDDMAEMPFSIQLTGDLVRAVQP